MKYVFSISLISLCPCLAIGQDETWNKKQVHAGYVSCVTAASDNEFLTGGADGNVFLVSAKRTGGVEKVFSRPDSIVMSIGFSHRLNVMMVGYSDGSMHGISLKNKKRVMSIQTDYPICSIAFSPTGEAFAAGVGNDIAVWSAKTGLLIHQLKKHENTVSCICFSADGNRLVSGSDSEVNIWTVSDGSLLRAFDFHRTVVRGVAFVGDNTIASCSLDKGVVFTGLKSGKVRFEKKIGHPSSLFYDEGRSSVFVSTFDGSVLTFTCKKDGIRLTQNDDFGSPMMSICTSRNSQSLCLGCGTPFGRSDAPSNKGIVAIRLLPE